MWFIPRPYDSPRLLRTSKIAGRGPPCQRPLTYEIITTCPGFPGPNRKGFSATVLMIRLARIGARKQPYYRVVVIEKERARNGRSVEIVGLYNPRTSPATFDIKRDRIDYWVSKGAQLSETVSRLLSKSPAPASPVSSGTAA
jgi:small subunit ribosomal protein S16